MFDRNVCIFINIDSVFFFYDKNNTLCNFRKIPYTKINGLFVNQMSYIL